MSDQNSINIIRNINRVCPYNCGICLVNAKYVKLDNNHINNPDYWINKGYEISLEDKIKIIDNLDYANVNIDVSGGEPLLFPEGLEVLKRLSEKFGKEKITLTTTGVSNINFDKKNISILESYIANIDFTYDGVNDLSYRPHKYSQNNLLFVSKFSKSVKKTAQIVLTKENISLDNIEKTIIDFKNHDIDSILLIKFFPVGRGYHYNNLVLSVNESQQAIDQYIFFSENHNGPKIIYQKNLLGGKIGATNSCSFLINEKGDLFSNVRKKDKFGKDYLKYKIGNLVDVSFATLCGSEYVQIKELQNQYNKN